jgi:hypothetical protein
MYIDYTDLNKHCPKDPVRTQIWHKADQVDTTDQTGVPQRSDQWGVL